MTIKLRPYQTQAVSDIRELMKQGCRSILYQGATGSGKTALTAHMLHTASGKGMRSFFIVHRRELIRQSSAAFKLEGLSHGIISAGYSEYRQPLVQLASVQTLARRIARYSSPALIVWDEAHHVAAGSWSSIFRRYSGAYHIGLTATPERLDGQGLGRYFTNMVNGPSVRSLIDQGYLSPYKLYAPMKINMGGVHTKMGDYVRSEMSEIVDKPSITGNALAHYKKFCYGKRAIVFAVSVEHSKHIVQEFIQGGFNAAHVDATTPADERQKAVENFAAGNIQVLSNVDLFSEGFDVPSVEAVILLRPTQSLGLFLQQIGRALRPSNGKTEAIILDHVCNFERHGLPDDDREWSLDGRAERGAKGSSTTGSVRVCPKCFAAQMAGLDACKFCQYVFEKSPREIEEKEGELSEIDIENIRRQKKQEQAGAESLEELTQIGIRRRYKHPRRWAYYVFKSRQLKKLQGSSR